MSYRQTYDEKIQAIASLLAIEDDYGPNQVDPSEWDVLRIHYERRAKDILCAIDIWPGDL